MKPLFVFLLVFAWPSLAQAQVTDGLIAWYPFGGNADDASGNEHHGGVFGAILTEDRFGNPDEAYLFDGVDDFISVMDHPSLRLSNQDYSTSLWVKFLNPGDADSISSAILSKRINYNGHGGYLFQRIGYDNPIEPDIGKVSFIVSGGTAPSAASTNAMAGEEWYHLTFVYSIETQSGQLFVDGSLDAEGLLFSPTSNNSAPLYFGKDEIASTNFYLYGILDDVRIYEKKLSLEEVQEIMDYDPLNSVTESEGTLTDPCPINVFPNPNINGRLNIETPGNCKVKTIRVQSPNGILLKEVLFSSSLSLSTLPRGMVFLEFLDEEGELLKVKKVMVEGY